MGVTPLRAEPVDNSGGIMHVRYLLGDRIMNIQRIHLNTDVASVAAGIFTALADIVRAYFDNAWTIQLSAFDGVVGGVPFKLPTPVAADVPGTTGAATAGIAALTRTIFTFPVDSTDPADTQKRGLLEFVGIGGSVPGRQVNVSGTAGGTATDQALVAYVTDAANHIVSHGGLPLLAPATKSTPLDKPERRKSMRKR